MISVITQGRLGNQLFQYAFAYSISRSLGTSFFIYRSRYDNFVLPRYFKLRKLETTRMLLLRIPYLLLRLFKKPQSLAQSGWDEASSVLQSAEGHRFANWSGFFQSLAYFKTQHAVIQKLFEPRLKYRKAFEQKYGKLFGTKEKVAVIHVRRTDYLEWGNDRLGGKNMTLPMEYYDRCIEAAGGLSGYHTIVLSDDIEFVKDHFSNRAGFFFEHNNEIIDFQLLMHADVLIASNSSFAWWGAVLNKRDAKVYAPKYWLGFKIGKPYPVNIMDDLRWTWVKVGAQ